MIVTKTELLSKTKVKVYLDGEFAFVLYKGEMKRFHIKEGEEIEEEAVRKIRSDVIFKRARKRALHLLENMDRTEADLREKLRQGLYSEEAVENAVEYVRSFGYLNDRRYAENFVISRRERKSRREIHALLLGKGIPEEMVGEVFEQYFKEAQEHEAIRRALRKKRIDPSSADEQEMRKIYGYLARKGFCYDAVRQVIQNYNENA